MLEGPESLIESYSWSILYLSHERLVNEDHLSYILCAREGCEEELLTKMHSYLWLLDFHDL
jgi:hypothetical protein